ncbi:isopentenyldiphosphate isomerase [Rhizobium sp. BK313]|uniref:NUDIX hydrolase n=1 Tax=Rhizobium sp. BK313 TaxID=2587081 RepID=UPI00105E7851|nr:NUDIX domain-containing protein [Rhizobium sp. BK313]MBB3452577.1 isopentenyldiphosphate isomerase [Rhizobium sp. BK313]
MSGLIDVLDENGLRTGEVLTRKEVHALGKPHRVIHLYLFNQDNMIVLQKRSQYVDHYPGAFTISVLCHIDAGESSMDSARREIKEELGLNPDGYEIDFLFSYRRDAILSPTYIDKHFNDIYIARGTFCFEDISIDKGEVESVELVPYEIFIDMINDKTSKLADIYFDECQDVIYFVGNSK